MKHLAEWRVTKEVPGVPGVFTHSIAFAIFRLWDLLGRSHPPLQGNNTRCCGLLWQRRILPTFEQTWRVLGFFMCSIALNTSCPYVKILGCTACPYALAIFCWYLWLLLLATSRFSSSPSRSTSLSLVCVSFASPWISSSTTLGVGTFNFTRLMTSVL